MTITLTSLVSSERLWPTIVANDSESICVQTTNFITSISTNNGNQDDGKSRHRLTFKAHLNKWHEKNRFKTKRTSCLSLSSKMNTIVFYACCMSCFMIGCRSAPIKITQPSNQLLTYPKLIPNNITENDRDDIINRDHHPWRWRLSKAISLIQPGKRFLN